MGVPALSGTPATTTSAMVYDVKRAMSILNIANRTEAALDGMSHECVTKLFCDVRLLRRIALRCMAALSGTGFSLCTVNGPQLKPHRLKPVPLDRAGPPLAQLAVDPAGNFHRVHVRIAD